MIRRTVLDFKLDRTDEALTAHGGLALMAEYNYRIGLRERVDDFLPRPGSNRGYRPSVFVESLVLMLQAGGRSLEDLRDFEREGVLMGLIGVTMLPDPDTMGDWLRRMGDVATGRAGLLGLDRVRDHLSWRMMSRDGVSAYTLDVDATQIEAEKREAAWTYQGVRGYMPLLGFLFETGLCLLDEFREGNVAPQAEQLAFYRACRGRMPHGKRIARYRADSASYQAELINALEADGVNWAITVDQDAAVKAVIRRIPEEAWHEPVPGCGYQIGETIHTMNKTDRAFRLIVKRWCLRRGDLFDAAVYGYHGIGSNWPIEEKGTLEVLEWHHQRGQAENFNKELKSGFGLERMPCGQFGANAMFLRVGVIAYNLVMGFKMQSCPAAWRSHKVATLRWKIFHVGGRIVRHAGRMILKLRVDRLALSLLQQIRQACFELSWVT